MPAKISGQNEVVVVEPPFLEPSLLRPEAHRIARMIGASGIESRVLDINLALYLAILSEAGSRPLVGGRDVGRTGLLADAIARAFFVDPEQLRLAVDRRSSLPGDVPQAVIPAMRDDDGEPLRLAVASALHRVAGRAAWQGHAQYVQDVELLNAAVHFHGRMVARELTLSLHGCEMGEDITSSAEVLSLLRNPSNPLLRLFDRYLGLDTLASKFGQARVVLVISEEPQLVPGLALAAWLKSRLGLRVAITGSHVDLVMSLSFPNLAGLVDEVIAHRFEYGGPSWLFGESHPLVVTIDGLTRRPYPAFLSASRLRPQPSLPGIVPVVFPGDYLSPLPLVGATVTSRCYWAKCSFCSISTGRDYPFAHLAPDALLKSLRQLSDVGVEHLQFMDYALPPRLLRAIAEGGPTGVRWAAQVRFERAFEDPQLFSRLAVAGCVALCWGFESASERVLALSTKGGLTDPHSRARVLKASADAGILNGLFVIAGLPGESRDDFERTADWLASNASAISFIEAYPFQLRPQFGRGANDEHEVRMHGPLASNGRPPSIGDWALELPSDGVQGVPSATDRLSRADILGRAFASLPSRSRTNDWLEGHLSLARTLVA